MKYSNILEEEIKNKVSKDFFSKFDCTKIIGKIDFAVRPLPRPHSNVERGDTSPPAPLQCGEGRNPSPSSPLSIWRGAGGEEYLLWAEAKQKPTDIIEMLTQLVLTIGKARTFDEILPPPFLGCYDNEKIAFVPYSEIQEIFYQNDFNWNVAPSNLETREFKQVYSKIQKILNNNVPWKTSIFYFEKDEKELKRFIKDNFVIGKTDITKIKIDKNNFIIIYNKWLETVKPTIQVDDWALAKKYGILDGDFYLADLLSSENKTLKEKLFVLLKTDHYELDRKIDESGFKNFKTTSFSDNQKAHTQFWAKYERPPLEDYWDYIIERRDLLVPQDVRERKGSFFTPKIWVELSQKYIADVLGADWQDEYYVWDCAAGTGNLLAGLTNKYNIWASTLDKADVEVMKQRIKNGANLLEDHVFQFDFLNDDFNKLPKGLQNIINDEEKRRKLVIYINPPYAEAGKYGMESKSGISKTSIYKKYVNSIGYAATELFTQFIIRIYLEIPDSKLAIFSKLKYINAPNFKKFRELFLAKYLKGFIVRADTFDNVIGQFPISFLIWDLSLKKTISTISCDVLNNEGKFFLKKNYHGDLPVSINKWISLYNKGEKEIIGFLSCATPMFQNQDYVYIENENREKVSHYPNLPITKNNLIATSVYFAVRKAIPATWLNDRDQFLYPNDGWEIDEEFQNDCLTYTLFNNNIQSQYGVNHWIPFTEYQVGARDKFDSNFMTDFISGKAKVNNIVSEPMLFYGKQDYEFSRVSRYVPEEREFSEMAQNVFKAGRELWKYYHSQPKCNVNASLYDIREYFQERNDKGKMNNKSKNETYNELIDRLRTELKKLVKKIEPKVYEYGFLRM